ncbi:ketopantoate reductase C-terminal domain-containing protein [Ihubacter sp. mB4P-1]|uniref:ketopantoate reductase family protein n=1 Tax=Ihubacter sp. mB4P-1 TaxID=3242370 RepID=UPI00137A587A
MDILIKNGTIVDGSGGEPYQADIAVEDGKITAIGSLSDEAKCIIDAGGKYVTPGFIDMHSHSDSTVPIWPDLESALVLSLQNGLGNADILMGHFPKEQIGYSVVAYGGSRTAAGEIYTHASVGNLHLAVTAYASSQREKLCEMAQHLKAVQFHMECYTPERLDKVLWTKLTTNCVLNGACAICQCTDDALFSCKEGVDLAKLIVSENCAVARALGIDLTPADIPMVYYEVMPRKQEGYRHFPSMAVDVQNHRKTEIDFINGAVVRAGENAGIPTPYNRMILLLMRVVEENYDV